MSKPIKNMIVSEYKKRFEDIEGAVLIEIRGMPTKTTTLLRAQMRTSDVRVTVVKNTLAKRAFMGTPLEALAPGLKGPRAIVYGKTSVVTIARELVKSAKTNDKLLDPEVTSLSLLLNSYNFGNEEEREEVG